MTLKSVVAIILRYSAEIDILGAIYVIWLQIEPCFV